MYLTQLEADTFLKLDKVFLNTPQLQLGNIEIDETHDLSSLDQREFFLLDISRCRLNFKKIRFQNRSRIVNILARVDLVGAPHRNPDGEILECPHIHIYREGYNDKWAYQISNFITIRDTSNIVSSLEDFAVFCNIINLPPIQYKHV